MRTFDKFVVLFFMAFIAGCSSKSNVVENYNPYPEVRAEYVMHYQGLTLDGRSFCDVKPKCTSDELLPPQPCSQPLPTYYQNISETEMEKGILLIHPYSRTKVLCLEYEGFGALQCAENYKQKGFVLVTDIPQFVAKYDTISRGSYPTRKWRGGGELYPRF